MNNKITLHTIATYDDKEYELQDLLNNLLNELQIKDNMFNELKQNKRDYERENILEMKLHILNNNWNELKEYIERFLYMLNGILDRDIYEQCQLDDFTQIMDKIKELESK